MKSSPDHNVTFLLRRGNERMNELAFINVIKELPVGLLDIGSVSYV